MSYKIQSSFSAGELDPALHERTTFDKYKTGLKTLRNAHIGKTGRIISRAGQSFVKLAKNPTAFEQEFLVDSIPNDTLIVNGAMIPHVFGTGTKVQVSSNNTLPPPLVALTDYYVIRIDQLTYKLATSEANAYAGIAIDITGVGVGTHTISPAIVDSKKVVLFAPPYTNFLLEWSHRYARLHNVLTNTYQDFGHGLIEDDIPFLQFFSSGQYIYILRFGKTILKLDTLLLEFVTDANKFAIPVAPTFTSYSVAGAPSGYPVDYQFTQIVNGEESQILTSVIAGQKLPINLGEENHFVVGTLAGATELRAYRRPREGNAFGFVGSTVPSAGIGTFIDYGGDADYTHTPPTQEFNAINGLSRAGVVYQQKLILSDSSNEEAIYASRTGFQNDFYRDYPLSSDGALTFKVGTSGNAKVLRLMDNGGLLVFTSAGIYLNTGVLSPTNLAMSKKGNWVIDEKVPPLEVPAGILFVDKSTNTIRSLIFSSQAEGQIESGDEISIFSNHLFVNKRVVSWAFQEGEIPLIWVVLDDGTLATLTYLKEHQMQAWSHCDTDGKYESVAITKDITNKSVVYFIIERDGKRVIEKVTDRFVTDLKKIICMDSAVSFNSEISSGANVLVIPTDPQDWSAELKLKSDIAIFANTPNNGQIDTIFRFFDKDGSAIDLVVTAFNATDEVIVQPSAEFPFDETSGIKLFRTFKTLTGLSHLIGKRISLMIDGYVKGSPNNDVESYKEYVVNGAGELILDDDEIGAFIHVGLPFTSDVETLDIDTIEEKPSLLESKIINKVYLKIYNSKGLYVGSALTVNESVENMEDIDSRTEDIDFGNIGNAADKLMTKRIEFAIPNDWKTNGRICLRQVDPLPFEILSIIPDLSWYIGGEKA